MSAPVASVPVCPMLKYVGSYHAVLRSERNTIANRLRGRARIFRLRYGNRTVNVRIRLGRFVRVRLARDRTRLIFEAIRSYRPPRL